MLPRFSFRGRGEPANENSTLSCLQLASDRSVPWSQAMNQRFLLASRAVPWTWRKRQNEVACSQSQPPYQNRTFLPQRKADMFRSSQGLVDLLGSSIFFVRRRKTIQTKKHLWLRGKGKSQIDQDPFSGHFLVNIICHNLFDPYFMCQNTERFCREVVNLFFWIKGVGKLQ